MHDEQWSRAFRGFTQHPEAHPHLALKRLKRNVSGGTGVRCADQGLLQARAVGLVVPDPEVALRIQSSLVQHGAYEITGGRHRRGHGQGLASELSYAVQRAARYYHDKSPILTVHAGDRDVSGLCHRGMVVVWMNEGNAVEPASPALNNYCAPVLWRDRQRGVD
jgi:hypothetical protein